MEDGVTLRWTVRSDQIDSDRWAKAVFGAIKPEKRDLRAVGRWWIWPLFAFLFLSLFFIMGPMVLVSAGVPVLLVIGLVIGLNVTAKRRLAKQLEALPAFREGFTFAADRTGTNRSGSAGSDQFPWRRYRVARLDGDVVTLLMDNNTVSVLPVVALDGSHEPGDAIAQMNEWINTAEADGSTSTASS